MKKRTKAQSIKLQKLGNKRAAYDKQRLLKKKSAKITRPNLESNTT